MENYDVIVIGGGPGGSTCAAFLQKQGRKVLVLERERFPRFHIGESLLPYGNDILRESGVWEKVESAGFMPKFGAEFCTANGSRFQRYWFNRSFQQRFGQTFQVERSKFDKLLLDHAADSGATVLQEAMATGVELLNDGCRVEYTHGGTNHRARASWLIDATGRDTFLGRQLNLQKEPTQIAKRIATYAHFKGVFRNEGQARGHITIVRLDGGWFWLIPLDDEKTSVGYVQRIDGLRATGLKPEESFHNIVEQMPELRSRMKNAERTSDFYTTSDYSYRHKTFARPRCLMVGDAAGFVDPIFSSGVMMALRSGRLAAQMIDKCEKQGTTLTESMQRRYTREVCRMMDIYVNMICAFYNDISFEVFMSPSPFLKLQNAVVEIVGGNTDLPWRLQWRMRVFYLICKLQRRLRIAPTIDFSSMRGKTTTKTTASV